MALEGEEEKEMAKAIKQILSQCILTENFKIDNLALVDVEYIFLKVRGKAVGDKSKIYIECTNTECENKVEIELDLEAIKIDTHKDHTDLIKLTDDIQVRMVPPKMEYLMATVSKNQIDIVTGEGVVGQTPTLKPNDNYNYSSGCLLKSNIGAMKGYYTMIDLDTFEQFKVIVPTFQLTTQLLSN